MSTVRRASSRLSIGQLARAAGVNVETVRYYQRIRLLPSPTREPGAIARYAVEDLRRLRFVKRAQTLGFSLDEVALLLQLADGRHCAETRRLAEKKLEIVARKLADLQAMKKTLKALVSACSKTSGERGCPLIDALLDHQVSVVHAAGS